jgi:hypothetical protein
MTPKTTQNTHNTKLPKTTKNKKKQPKSTGNTKRQEITRKKHQIDKPNNTATLISATTASEYFWRTTNRRP